MSRVLITGGSGFIGTNLVEHYIRDGSEVLNLDIAPPRNPAHQDLWQNVDIRDPGPLTQAIQALEPELVFHLAARTDLDGKTLEDYSSNTVGLERLIEVLREVSSLRRVIFASSRLVCRIGYVPEGEDDYCPSTVYGHSKMRGELIVRDSAPTPFDWIIVRPTSIWGPWFGIPYNQFFKTVMSGRYIHPRGRRILKSFGYVGNSVHQLITLSTGMGDSLVGRTIYLADYPPTEVLEMAQAIKDCSGSGKVRVVPIQVLKIIALCGDFLKVLGMRNPPLTSFRLDNLLTEMVLPLDQLKDAVGELPFTSDDGIQTTVEWIADYDS